MEWRQRALVARIRTYAAQAQQSGRAALGLPGRASIGIAIGTEDLGGGWVGAGGEGTAEKDALRMAALLEPDEQPLLGGAPAGVEGDAELGEGQGGSAGMEREERARGKGGRRKWKAGGKGESVGREGRGPAHAHGMECRRQEEGEQAGGVRLGAHGSGPGSRAGSNEDSSGSEGSGGGEDGARRSRGPRSAPDRRSSRTAKQQPDGSLLIGRLRVGPAILGYGSAGGACACMGVCVMSVCLRICVPVCLTVDQTVRVREWGRL